MNKQMRLKVNRDRKQLRDGLRIKTTKAKNGQKLGSNETECEKDAKGDDCQDKMGISSE